MAPPIQNNYDLKFVGDHVIPASAGYYFPAIEVDGVDHMFFRYLDRIVPEQEDPYFMDCYGRIYYFGPMMVLANAIPEQTKVNDCIVVRTNPLKYSAMKSSNLGLDIFFGTRSDFQVIKLVIP